MKINLRINLEDGTSVDVSATARDLVAYEEKFQKSVTVLDVEKKLTDTLWIAWHYLHRTEKIKSDFEEFCDSVASVESGEEDPK